MNQSEAITQLSERGWKFTAAANTPFVLPEKIAARHPQLPHDFVEFMSGLASCANQDQTTWFLCQDDYEGKADSAFRWDEFEQMSIESADGDSEILAEINAFWSDHLPFILSVHSGYAFYAIRTAVERFGEVVEGCEPIFEEACVVAASFSDFLKRFLTEVEHDRLSPIDRND